MTGKKCDLEEPKVNRPKVKLEEIGQGQGTLMAVMVMLMALMGVAAIALGAVKVLGSGQETDSQMVWQARQQEQAAQTYERYVAEQDDEADQSGLLLLVSGPFLIVAGAMFYWASTSEYTKCPAGHVTRKSHSYCHECGGKVYLQDELSPDEWRKRYGDSGAAGS